MGVTLATRSSSIRRNLLPEITSTRRDDEWTFWEFPATRFRELEIGPLVYRVVPFWVHLRTMYTTRNTSGSEDPAAISCF